MFIDYGSTTRDPHLQLQTLTVCSVWTWLREVAICYIWLCNSVQLHLWQCLSFILPAKDQRSVTLMSHSWFAQAQCWKAFHTKGGGEETRMVVIFAVLALFGSLFNFAKWKCRFFPLVGYQNNLIFIHTSHDFLNVFAILHPSLHNSTPSYTEVKITSCLVVHSWEGF